jgi:hypothetical protein
MVGMSSPMGEPWVVPWVVQSPMGRSVGDHVCWPFRDRGELAVVALSGSRTRLWALTCGFRPRVRTR